MCRLLIGATAERFVPPKEIPPASPSFTLRIGTHDDISVRYLVKLGDNIALGQVVGVACSVRRIVTGKRKKKR